MHLGMTDNPLGEVLVQCKAQVILQGTLWYEFGITHVGIVEIVECWHAETLLHIGPHREERPLERIDIHKKCRSQGVQGVRGVQDITC